MTTSRRRDCSKIGTFPGVQGAQSPPSLWYRTFSRVSHELRKVSYATDNESTPDRVWVLDCSRRGHDFKYTGRATAVKYGRFLAVRRGARVHDVFPTPPAAWRQMQAPQLRFLVFKLYVPRCMYFPSLVNNAQLDNCCCSGNIEILIFRILLRSRMHVHACISGPEVARCDG